MGEQKPCLGKELEGRGSLSYVESSQCFFQAHHQQQVPGSCGLRPGSATSGRSEKEDRKREGRTLPRCCSSRGSQVQLYASRCRNPVTSLPLCIVSRGSCARRRRAVMKRATAGAGGAWARRRAAAGGAGGNKVVRRSQTSTARAESSASTHEPAMLFSCRASQKKPCLGAALNTQRSPSIH